MGEVFSEKPEGHRNLWIVMGILLAHWALLLAGLVRQSLWIDEWFTVQDVAPTWQAFLPHLIHTERRPPLYWALLKLWMALAGQSELAMRFVSIAATVIVVAITFRLGLFLLRGQPYSIFQYKDSPSPDANPELVEGRVGRGGRGVRSALIAAALIGFSPFLLLYGRMIRSYALFTLLTAAATWALLRLESKLTFGRWLAYMVLAVALLYTDYGAWAVLGAQGLWLVTRTRPHRSPARPDRSRQATSRHSAAVWRPVRSSLVPLSALLLAGLAFTPWINVMLTQAGHNVLEADLARSGLGLALKLIFPFAALGAGETIYPWHPLAALTILLCGLLAVNGFLALVGIGRSRLKRDLHDQHPSSAWLLALWFGLSLVFTATILSTVAADITFLNMASRAPHLVIAYSLLIAAGISALKNSRARLAALSLIALTFALALFNYYTGQAFYNPIYAVPIRQIVEEVKQQSTVNDLIIADSDTLFGYYYLAQPGAATYQDSDFATNRTAIESQPPTRIWLITFGRDRTTGLGQVDELRDWLKTNYVETSHTGYGEVGPSYRWVKQQLLHREAYEYKLRVEVYIKIDEEQMTKDQGPRAKDQGKNPKSQEPSRHSSFFIRHSSFVIRPPSSVLRP